jgi:hypothetical protein
MYNKLSSQKVLIFPILTVSLLLGRRVHEIYTLKWQEISFLSVKIFNVHFFVFQIGRGMRLSPGTGKKDCRIIDFVDSLSRVEGVVSIPNLFGLDPAEIDPDGE